MCKKIKSHIFKINGKEKIEEGKSHWPDCLEIGMRQYKALDIIRQLASSLQTCGEEDDIYLSFMGKLDYDIDENA
ncbi:MAG: hypothetical protein ACFFG0_06365 [Candidatus Thorarchaeota archaeon]